MYFDFKNYNQLDLKTKEPGDTTLKRKSSCKELFPSKKSKPLPFGEGSNFSQEKLNDHIETEEKYLEYLKRHQTMEYEENQTHNDEEWYKTHYPSDNDEVEHDRILFETNYLNLQHLITKEEIEMHSQEDVHLESYLDIINTLKAIIFANSTSISLKRENEIVSTIQYINNEITHVHCSYCYVPFWCEHVCSTLMFVLNHAVQRESNNAGVFNFKAMNELLYEIYETKILKESDSQMVKTLIQQVFQNFTKLFKKKPTLALEIIETLTDAIVNLGSQHNFESCHYSVLNFLCVQWMSITEDLSSFGLEKKFRFWFYLTKNLSVPNFAVVSELIQHPLSSEVFKCIFGNVCDLFFKEIGFQSSFIRSNGEHVR
jgi:hypothetical protein